MTDNLKEQAERYSVETADGLSRSFGPMQWLADAVANMRKKLRGIDFYQKMAQADSVQAFGWTRQLLYHSKEFPQILAARYARCRDDRLRLFLMDHVVVEAGHSGMLREWMLQHGFIQAEEAYTDVPRTLATTACISHCWRLIDMESVEAQIIGLNVATECASWDFFSSVTPLLERLGACHEYWRVHVVADQFHSADGLMQLKPIAEGSREGKYLLGIARESLTYWGFMLNSWVGVERMPKL